MSIRSHCQSYLTAWPFGCSSDEVHAQPRHSLATASTSRHSLATASTSLVRMLFLQHLLTAPRHACGQAAWTASPAFRQRHVASWYSGCLLYTSPSPRDAHES
eukprot:253837-Chlamydomonas_euryale.AAC.2